MATTTETTIETFLAERGSLWPATAVEIAENTGYPLSTVYVALKALQASRTRRDKNQFGYVLPDKKDVEFTSVEETLGRVNGKAWNAVASSTMHTVAEAHLTENLTAAEYAEGFEALGYRFLELAAHAEAVKDRPDWRIVLGFDTDTEKS